MTNLEAQDRKRRTPSEGNISCPRELGGSVGNVNGGKLVKSRLEVVVVRNTLPCFAVTPRGAISGAR